MFTISVHMDKISHLNIFKLEILNLGIWMNPGFRHNCMYVFRPERQPDYSVQI